MDKLARLQDRIAVVTGGGSGIGAAICMRFAAEGARVAVLDLHPDAARNVAEQVGGLAVVCDVGDSRAVDRAFDEVEAALGPIDVLVNNAGITTEANVSRVRPRAEAQMAEVGATGKPPTTHLDAVVRMLDDEWEQMLRVNLSSVFFCTRRALQSMQPRGSGSIVNMASICGIEGCAGFFHYSAAKAGVLGFTRAVAKEVIGYGIRMNAVAPGFVDTPMMDTAGDLLAQAFAMQVPQARLGRPEEIAAVVAFLASDDASYMVGQTVSPNGGFTM